MRAWLGNHWNAASYNLRRAFRTPLSGIASIFVIGIALSLPAALYLLMENVRVASNGIDVDTQLTVFADPALDATATQNLGALLRADSNVAKVQFIEKSAALRDLARQWGAEDLAATLPVNPLPDAYKITPKLSDSVALASLKARVEKLPGASSVLLDTAWAERLQSFLALLETATLILTVLLAVALVAVGANTIRLQILTQRDEIEISKLIGATNRFIRRPFLYFGTLQGLLGGLAAWAIIAVAVHVLEPDVRRLAHLYGSAFTLRGLKWDETLILIGVSAALGWFSAYLASSRFLRAIDPR